MDDFYHVRFLESLPQRPSASISNLCCLAIYLFYNILSHLFSQVTIYSFSFYVLRLFFFFYFLQFGLWAANECLGYNGVGTRGEKKIGES